MGNVDERGRFLVDITEECLYKAIGICGPGVPLQQIGASIEDHAEANGLSVVAEFVGHGIGKFFHGPPTICHYSECTQNSSRCRDYFEFAHFLFRQPTLIQV